MRLFIGLILFTTNVLAMDWVDLEVSSNYKLKQSFQLPQLERSGSLIDLMTGEEFILTEIYPLEMIRVTLLKFHYKNYPGEALETEMKIIPVKNTIPVVEVGAQIQKNCQLEIFIESKDLMTKSFFD